MEKQNEKSCDNCYYFYQHYFKSKHGKLMPTDHCGHCVNGNLTKSASRKIISKKRICEFWEPNETKEVEMRENVYKLISRMKERLDELALLLKED